MAQTGGSYREELEHESKQTDPNSHASRLIAQELERLNKGEDELPTQKKSLSSIPLHDAHQERPQKLSFKIRLPIKEYPRYNFVGKLLGPKGQTLKALQEQTGCKMAIMGRGSMRDKEKEEELRKEGGKYAHLEEDLHVLVECYAEIVDGHHRIAEATRELKKFVIPIEEFEEGEGGGMNGAAAPRGRGGFRGGAGGPPERGGRGGSFRGGRGAGPPPVRGGRGGGPPAPRGGPRGRGGAPPPRGGGRGAPSNSSYDGYGSQSYGSGGGSGGGYDSSYDNYSGGQAYSGGGGDSQYYDYGNSNSQSSGYDSYSGYEYGEGWNSAGGKTAAPSGRGSSRGQARSHPYPRPSGGGSANY